MIQRENLRHLAQRTSAGHLLRQILEAIRQHGGRGFLVGGCVRDALLGRPAHDLDVEVYGLTPENLRLALKDKVRLDSVGASFGVLKVHGADIDVALPRRETKLGLGHRDFGIDTDPFLDVKEAAARRDLTINAILYDPLDDDIIDPWNGLGDLQRKILRHVSQHFSEDPLRVLRIMQFTARLDFPVAEETIALCRSITPENLPRERIGDEWEKLLLKGIRPSAGLIFLKDAHWLPYFPELETLVTCPQNPKWHPEGSVWNHTLLTVDAAATLRHYDQRLDNLALMAAALCHDLGKPLVTHPGPDGQPVSPGHDCAGIQPTTAFLRRLWLNLDLEKMVLRLVKCHMRAHEVAKADTDRAYRRLAADVERMDLLADLFEADLRASKPRPLDIVNQFRDRTRDLDIRSQAPKPIIQGRHLMAMGMKPGPQFGTIVRLFYDRQLDGDFQTLEQGLECLRDYLQQQRLL